MASQVQVEEGLKKIVNALPSSLEKIIAGWQEGGAWNALGAAATSIGSSILKQDAYKDQANAINEATSRYMAGIEQLIALENIFADTQKEQLMDAFGLTKAQIEENLRNDPQFIVDAYKYVENTFDPQITERFSDTINNLSTAMEGLTTDQLSAFEGALTSANSLIADSDRVLSLGYDEAGKQLSVAKGNILSGTGEARTIVGGLNNFGQAELQRGLSDAVSNQQIGATTANKYIEGGLREALNQGGAYVNQGTKGLNAFSDTALNPNSDLFSRNLAKSQEALNRQLYSRGLGESGAAIEAQSNLIQDMTMKEMERQTGLQAELAKLGAGQIAGQQNVIQQGATQQAQIAQNLANSLSELTTRSAEQKVQLAKDLGLVDANFVMSNAEQLSQIDQILAQNSINEAVQSGDISMAQAQNILQTGQLQGGSIQNYMNSLANVQSQAASQQLNTDVSQEQSIANARQQAVMSAVQRGMSLEDALTQFPLEQFQQNYNIDRSRLDQNSDLTTGQMNREQEALTALANLQGSKDLGLAEALRTMGGGSGGSSIQSGAKIDIGKIFESIANSDFVNTIRSGGDFRSALATVPGIGSLFGYSTDPNSGATTNTTENPYANTTSYGERQTNTSDFDWMNDRNSVWNDPFFDRTTPTTPTIPTNDMNGYDPSTQDAPSMFDSTPTDNDFFNPTPTNTLDVEVLDGRSKAGFGPELDKPLSPQAYEEQQINDRVTTAQQEISNLQNMFNQILDQRGRPDYRRLADLDIAIQERNHIIQNPTSPTIPVFNSQYAGNVKGGYQRQPSTATGYTPSQNYIDAINIANAPAPTPNTPNPTPPPSTSTPTTTPPPTTTIPVEPKVYTPTPMPTYDFTNQAPRTVTPRTSSFTQGGGFRDQLNSYRKPIAGVNQSSNPYLGNQLPVSNNVQGFGQQPVTYKTPSFNVRRY